jgi:hypothetical protein
MKSPHLENHFATARKSSGSHLETAGKHEQFCPELFRNIKAFSTKSSGTIQGGEGLTGARPPSPLIGPGPIKSSEFNILIAIPWWRSVNLVVRGVQRPYQSQSRGGKLRFLDSFFLQFQGGFEGDFIDLIWWIRFSAVSNWFSR